MRCQTMRLTPWSKSCEHWNPLHLRRRKVSEELRWRYVEGAVVFSYRRYLPIDFDAFHAQVDVARTIQFMNDYLGGVVLPLVHDASGTPDSPG